MIKRYAYLLICTFFAAMALASFAMAQVADKPPSDNRIRVMPYDATEVYSINTRYGYQTYIEFGASEEIETISVGDRSLWQIVPTKNRLFIRPMDINVSTNMTVITNRHAYQFDLKALGADSKQVVYVARFTYPEQEAHRPPTSAPYAMHQPAAPLTSSANAPISTPIRNYQYTFTGPDKLAPVQTFDDGKNTYLRFGQDQAMPRIVLVDVKGAETPVDPRMADGYVMIDRISPQIKLIYPQETVFLYNEWMMNH